MKTKIHTYSIQSKIDAAIKKKHKILVAEAKDVADVIRYYLKNTLLNASGPSENRRGLRDTTGMPRADETTSLPPGTLRKNVRVRVTPTKDGVKITPYFTGGEKVEKVVEIFEAGPQYAWVIPKNRKKRMLAFFLDPDGPVTSRHTFEFTNALMLQKKVVHPGLRKQPVRKMALDDKLNYAQKMFVKALEGKSR